MQINNNNYSIAELLDMRERRTLIINPHYQRGSGLWPLGARSYFIDTILEGYPFPKLYMYEYIDRATGQLKRELVDGQQRLATITDFVANRFALRGESRFSDLMFRDLEEDKQHEFLAYPVSVDVIRNANRHEILQMFRRMNAFTLPLNEAEKRHSTFHGEFKWFINRLSDDLNEFFVEYGVFTERQIVRMADAEILSDCILSIERGIVSTSASDLRSLYRVYDTDFPHFLNYSRMITETFEYITHNFSNLRRTHMMKPYALHSLVTALMHARFGIPSIAAQVAVQRDGRYAVDSEQAAVSLNTLAQAHEAKEIEGPHRLYIWGCSAGTNRAGRRLARIMEIFGALGFPVERVLDNELARLLPA